MTELVVIAGAVGGYVLYRKWKATREYNQRLEPKIPPSREEIVNNILSVSKNEVYPDLDLDAPFYPLGKED